MHDSSGSLVSLADFKALLGDFYEAYPVLAGHNVEMKNILVNSDHPGKDRMVWYGKGGQDSNKEGRLLRIQAGQKHLRRLGYHPGKHTGMGFSDKNMIRISNIRLLKGVKILF